MSTATLLAALKRIVDVEPRPVGSQLDILSWANALDEAQRIARDVLDEWGDE